MGFANGYGWPSTETTWSTMANRSYDNIVVGFSEESSLSLLRDRYVRDELTFAEYEELLERVLAGDWEAAWPRPVALPIAVDPALAHVIRMG